MGSWDLSIISGLEKSHPADERVRAFLNRASGLKQNLYWRKKVIIAFYTGLSIFLIFKREEQLNLMVRCSSKNNALFRFECKMIEEFLAQKSCREKDRVVMS